MSRWPDISPEDGALAAEYALGVLTDEERAAVEARLPREPALRAEVVAWQSHFAATADAEIDAIAPPARVEQGVWDVLFATPARPKSPLQRVGFWQALTALSTGAAAVAVVFAVLPIVSAPELPGVDGLPEVSGIAPGTILMSHLAPTEGARLGLAATLEPSGALQVRRVAGTPGEGREQQLWLLVGENAPVSLGLLSDEPLTTLTPDAETVRLFQAGAVLAISDEPPGGSPTGAPTGTVLAVGSLIAL